MGRGDRKAACDTGPVSGELRGLMSATGHELNNLLTIINGNAQLALMDQPADSRLRESLEDIQTACRRAMKVTRQLLPSRDTGEG